MPKRAFQRCACSGYHFARRGRRKIEAVRKILIRHLDEEAAAALHWHIKYVSPIFPHAITLYSARAYVCNVWQALSRLGDL